MPPHFLSMLLLVVKHQISNSLEASELKLKQLLAKGRIATSVLCWQRVAAQFAGVGPKTRIVDLEEKFVVPGFMDSHVHFISGGLQVRSGWLSSQFSGPSFNRNSIAISIVDDFE